MTHQSRHVAHQVMVLGVPAPEVATTLGITPQRVSSIVAAVAAAAQPEGWVTRVISAPPDLMREFLARVDRARADALKSSTKPRPD